MTASHGLLRKYNTSEGGCKEFMTQCEKILSHIKAHGSITSMDAFTLYRITRLSGRIKDLRDQGYPIVTEMETKNGATYARYRMEDGDVQV